MAIYLTQGIPCPQRALFHLFGDREKVWRHTKKTNVWYSGTARNMQKMWSLQHPASSLAINPFWVILSIKDHTFHRAWPSYHWLQHSKLADWEFQAALRRSKCPAVKTFSWFVPSARQCLGLLSLTFNVLPLFPFVHDLLGLCVWKDSKFPSFFSYTLLWGCSHLAELDEQSTQTGDSVFLPPGLSWESSLKYTTISSECLQLLHISKRSHRWGKDTELDMCLLGAFLLTLLPFPEWRWKLKRVSALFSHRQLASVSLSGQNFSF